MRRLALKTDDPGGRECSGRLEKIVRSAYFNEYGLGVAQIICRQVDAAALGVADEETVYAHRRVSRAETPDRHGLKPAYPAIVLHRQAGQRPQDFVEPVGAAAGYRGRAQADGWSCRAELYPCHSTAVGYRRLEGVGHGDGRALRNTERKDKGYDCR